MNATDQTLSRRKLTIADLRPISRIPAPVPTLTPQARPAAKSSVTILPDSVPAPVPTLVPATAVPCAIERDADGFPCGWCFDTYSFGFHRSLWFEHGIRLDVGEYAALIQQCHASKRTSEWLRHDICRVRLRSGRPIVVAVRKPTPLVVLPDTGWEQYSAWADALVRYMPDPPLTPHHAGRPAKRTRKRRDRRARRRAERLAQVTGLPVV